MRKLILVLNILVMMVCTVWGQSYVWDGEPADNLNPIAGNENVYHISTAAELAKLAELVNDGNDFAGMTVILQNDIFLNEGVLGADGKLNSGGRFNKWTPIGNYKNRFQGTFDGNGKKVSGVYIDDGTQNARLGLFGYLGEGGRIQNVGVEDSYVKGTGNYDSVGGVCGYSNGGSIFNSYNAGSVEGTGFLPNVGGVCGGFESGLISNSYNAGSVEGETFVGGVCGHSSGTILNSYNAGSVKGDVNVGGVCGYSIKSGTISNSYNAGSVEGTGGKAKVGGVCGYSEDDGPITDCFYLAGTATSGIGEGNDKDLPSKKFGTEFIAAVEEWLEVIEGESSPNPSPWKGGLSLEQDKLMLPHLNIGDNVPAISCPEEPSEIDGFYEIYTATQLRWFAKEVNGGATTINGKLMQDIAVSEYTLDNDMPPADPQNYWTPIGKDHNKPFTGTFDGLGNKVSGVYIDGGNNDANLGLFGCLGYGGVIENIGVVDNYVKGTGGNASVGGVCGYSEGSILNSYNAGSVEGGHSASVGGVCGYSQGTISESYNVGSVTGKGAEDGNTASVGGVCGMCGRSGSISNSYNAGLVTGENAPVGGVCGYNFDENNRITDCYYLAGTATNGIGKGVNSGNETATPKTADDLAKEMAGKLTGDFWKGTAKYENGTLTLPTFSGSNPIVIQLAAVPEDAWKNVIDFEGEKLAVSVDYQVIAGTSLEDAGPVENKDGEALLTDLIDNSATLYIYHLGKVSEVLEYKLTRPDAPTDFSVDTKKTTVNSITLNVIDGAEYRMDSKDWQDEATFDGLDPNTEYTFYARIKATESSFASLPSIDVKEITKANFTITISSSENGNVTADKTEASEGETVTLTVTPSEGYELASLKVTGTNVSGSGNERTFEMPGENVTVTATFNKVEPDPTPEPEPEPTPDPDPVYYYTVTIPSEITGAIIHGGGTHQVREGSYIDFSIEIDPAGTGEYPTVTVDGYWRNPLRPDTRGNYRVYVYDDDCDIRIGEVSGYGTYTLTLPADSLFEGDDLYRSGVGIAVTPASSSPSSDALRYPFGTELTLTAVSDRHRAFVEWMDGSRRSPLTFRLREDTEAYAWFRALHPVGNEEIAVAGIRIRTERGGSIVIDTPTRLPIAIYALSGQCLRRSESEGTTRFSGLREGSYLVVVGTHSEVVIVR
nr:fibronectin type III domain-containing protein [Parabacteroides goldsteinii]